jgi:sialate O-acetylesterase
MTAFGILLAAVQLASPFADHMLLQRDRSVPVWGTGTPGEVVAVEFAGQRLETKAGGDGRWRVDLAPMPACCKGRTLSVFGGRGATALPSVAVNDVLVGEVWLCAGQSNMGVPLCGGNPRYRDRQGSLIAQMTHRPMIRYVSTPSGNWDFKEHGRTASPIVWRAVIPENTTTRSFSAVALYFALDVESELHVPVGLVGVYRGATGIDCWTPPEGTRSRPDLGDIAEWQPVPKEKWTSTNVKGAINRADQQPAVYWNTVVAPWTPFACRGMLWYQGEHDSGEPQRYCSKLHALYDGWRGRFENPGMRFYFVQLCSWGSNIAPMQEAMAQFELECPNSAMAVINDLGSNADIHPNEKALAGHRLALHALRRDYGFKDIRDNSPSVESWRVASNTFEIVLKDCKSLYVYRKDWKFDLPFEVAGEDGVFHPAELLNLKTTKGYGGKPERKGDIEGERLLVVGSKDVAHPMHLRYLYCSPWTGYIFNEVNLPLGAFHLDCDMPKKEKQDANR